MEQQQAEREKCHRMMVGLYPDLKNGVISQEEYLTLKSDLQVKLQTLDDAIAKLRQAAAQYADGMEQEAILRSNRRILWSTLDIFPRRI